MMLMMQRDIGSRNLSSGSGSGSHTDPLWCASSSSNPLTNSNMNALGYSSSSRELLELYCQRDEVFRDMGGFNHLSEKDEPFNDGVDYNGSIDWMKVGTVSKQTSAASETYASASSLDCLGNCTNDDAEDPFADLFDEASTGEEPLFDFSESSPGEHDLTNTPTTVHSEAETTSLSSDRKRRSAHKLKRKRSGTPKRESHSTYTACFYTDLDVLLGRGGLINHHPGNKAYLQEKARLQQRYLTAGRTAKTSISLELVDWVYARGGRFMEKTSTGTNNKEWYEVERKRARAKASQTLREI